MIVYSLITRMNNVLGEYSDKDGDFVETGRKILKRSQRSSEKCSVTQGDLRYVFFSEDEFSFLAAGKAGEELDSVMRWLDKMSEAFYVQSEEQQAAGDGQSSYRWVSLLLKAQMDSAKVDPSQYQDHKLLTVEQELEEVTAIASQNIDRLVGRGVHLDDLMLKTDSLRKKALSYNIKTKKLSRIFNRDRNKTYLFALILILLLLAYWFIRR